MGKIAFVFSGQGDQYPGMGKEWCERYPAAAAVFQLCDRLRPGTLAQCFAGTEEELKETRNTQPCLYAMEMAAAAALEEAGIRPDAVAGFSLGEVTAAAAAGIFDCASGFRLVEKRGRLMQEAAEQQDTAMAAVVKLSAETVEALCRGFSAVYPVNYNCPGQITVSGLAVEMPEFYQRVREAGGRALPLKVRGAFHSPFMKEAAAAFADELAAVEIQESRIPLYSNVTADIYTEQVADLLSRQICRPVRWERLIRRMIADGMDTFVEIGPGKTLTNMIRKIDGSVKAISLSDLPENLTEAGLC